jgi:hypothetical protein
VPDRNGYDLDCLDELTADRLDELRDAFLRFSDREDAEEELHEILVAAVSSYARHVDETPRTVLEELFCQMPADEEWRREILPLLDAHVLELSAVDPIP